MSRNVESRFAMAPTGVNMSRSKFPRPSSIKFSADVGDLVPFYIDEVLPGDSFSLRTSKVVRFQPLVAPIYDNIYLDTYYFFCPMRLVWKHTKQFFGENTDSAWIPQNEYTIPQVTSPASTGWTTGTIADYMGIPVGVPGLSISALPFRAYSMIVNEWFRDQNLCDPLLIPDGDATTTGSNGDNYVEDCAKGGKPFKAAKYHDYFTSALPGAQKSSPVGLPISEGSALPVVVGDYIDTDIMDKTKTLKYTGYSLQGDGAWSTAYQDPILNTSATTPGNMTYVGSESGKEPPYKSSGTNPTYYNSVHPLNLWAIDSGSASAATINQLRMCFQLQRYYEKLARSGSRYTEQIRAFFGVTSPDARLQRPEYLGGNRIPIHINQVLQQSATEADGTPQGNPAAISLTSDVHGDFSHSFTEHGFLIGLMVARYPHSYQQGIERMWSRKTNLDFYWPTFAHLGEQPILNKEIYAQGSSVVDEAGDVIDEQVFGYQERYAEYKYKPNRIAGELRSQYAQSLDIWHLGDDYDSLPSLSASWIQEDKSPVDRVLAVSSSVSNQYWVDVYVENTSTRVMPMFSIPGLIDHY